MDCSPWCKELSYGSGDILFLSPNNAENWNSGIMTCYVTVVVHWGGGLLMFPKPLTKKILMTPLYIHHHCPPFGIWICRWCHLSLWSDLYLEVSSAGLWLYCLLCSAPVPHVYWICSSCSHSNPSHMVEAYRVCSDLSCYFYDFCFLYLVFWVSWCCLSPHVGPNWSTCPLSGHFVYDVLLHPVAAVLSIQLLPYGALCTKFM